MYLNCKICPHDLPREGKERCTRAEGEDKEERERGGGRGEGEEEEETSGSTEEEGEVRKTSGD